MGSDMESVFLLLTALFTVRLPGCGSLKMMNLTVPQQLVLGQSASLLCNYDLEGSQLYSVKWYKNGQEFFRYMPSMDEQYTVFDIPGVHVIHPTSGHSYRNFNKMQLNHVDMETGGVFSHSIWTNHYSSAPHSGSRRQTRSELHSAGFPA